MCVEVDKIVQGGQIRLKKQSKKISLQENAQEEGARRGDRETERK